MMKALQDVAIAREAYEKRIAHSRTFHRGN
jgi:ornithine cyclodeaminase/alanine dehydrogenase-like protein (mu-crystallin family)